MYKTAMCIQFIRIVCILGENFLQVEKKVTEAKIPEKCKVNGTNVNAYASYSVDGFFHIFHCSVKKNSSLKLQLMLVCILGKMKKQKENIIATAKYAPAAATLYFMYTAHVYYRHK